jgi:hypothetical protein
LQLDSLTWLTTNIVPCRKSTDLSWDGDEPSTAAAEEVFAPAAEESAPLPQAETVAPVAETTLPEASIVEGEYTAVMRASSSSSQSPQGTDPVCLVLTGAEVEDSAIPEVVPVEGVVPEAQVATEAATEPAEVAAPGGDRRGAWRCPARGELGSCRPFTRNPRRGADPFGADVRGHHD